MIPPTAAPLLPSSAGGAGGAGAGVDDSTVDVSIARNVTSQVGSARAGVNVERTACSISTFFPVASIWSMYPWSCCGSTLTSKAARFTASPARCFFTHCSWYT